MTPPAQTSLGSHRAHQAGRGARRVLSALRRAVLAVGIVAVTVGLLSPFAPAASAAPGDGTLTLTVIRDVNADGARNATLEPGLAGVQVILTDAAGAQQSLTTNASGQLIIGGAAITLTGGRYRVEVVNPRPGVLFPAFASLAGTPGAALSSNEEFIDLSANKNVTMTTGFWYPGDYCQSNPRIADVCNEGLNAAGTNWDTDKSMVLTNYQLNTAATTLNQTSTTGTTYGVAYNRVTRTLYQSAYAKRAAQYSASGQGAIFAVNPTSGATTLFATVPNAGTTAHVLNPRQDHDFTPVVGKESLGDIDITDDGKWLFAVNMNDRQLYVYDATQPTASAPSAVLPIPSQCADPTEWRPHALGLSDIDDKLYIGGVCSQSLTAHVTTMTIGATAAGMAMNNDSVLSQGLTYTRGNTVYDPGSGSCPNATWHPWVNAIGPVECATVGGGGQYQYTYAQPMFADIEFLLDGTMLASFRDRGADQYGSRLSKQNAAGWTTNANYVSGGDLLRACTDVTGSYVFDVNGGCGRTTEYFSNDVRRDFWGNNVHTESYYGGIVYIPTETGVVTNSINPTNAIYSDGMTNTSVFAPGTGNAAAGPSLQVIAGGGTGPGSGSFGKGQGLGDIEALCDLAPIQIGNRVWFDENRDGTQGAAEVPLPNVRVNLIKNGTVIATTTTNARGEYYFSSLTTAAITPDTDYVVEFVKPATGTVNLGTPTGTRPWTDLVLTTAETGPQRNIDSNPDPITGRYNLHVGGPGQNDHTIDAGYIIPAPPEPQYAKTSDPVPGTVVKPGDAVTYTVTAVNPSATQSITTGTLTDNMSAVLDKATLSPAGAVPVLTCQGPVGATCGAIVFNATAKTVVWTASAAAPLSAATTAKITYTVVVDAGATGTVGNVLVEPNITTEHPIITWDKVAVPAAGTLVNPGDVVSYTISVKNTGAVASNAFSVSDDLTDVVSKADLDPASITIDPAGLGAASYDAVTKLLTWTGVLQPGEEAKVTYQATVKADAFGEMRNHYFDKTVVNPISASLVWKKVDPQGDVLAGSEWELTPVDAGGVPTGPAIVVVDCVEAAAAACTGADTDPDAGEFLVIGLVPGAYSLVETKAPVGFVLLPDPVAVTVLGDAAVTTLPDIQNQQQGVPEIPLTGGWGSDYFFAGGGVLIVLAAGVCFLVWRRRTHQEA
ncbi:SdrD B-like domain-containing protein [Microbacterium sp. ZW T5_56]|uniref:DUF7927 domain-containing protein n=1 Tax=Microbacterium sp. ZW T5_56 TaxID=3378081 RepID=UPI003854109B